MGQETAILDKDLELETQKTTDGAALRTQSNTPGTHPWSQDAIPSAHSGSKSNFGARIKALLANIAKSVEGDHESHKYRS